MKRKKKTALLAFALAACMTLGACGTAESGADTAAETEIAETETQTAQTETQTAETLKETETAQAETETAETETQGAVSDDPLEFVRDMKIGWNLGNTFDAYEDGTSVDELSLESYWCGTTTTKEMIDAVCAAGFRTLRIPVSWHNHVSGDGYTISAAWLDRVQEVVDYALDDGMYVILNVHHDIDANYCYPDSAHLESSVAYLAAVWTQIAERFKDYDEYLIFEGINEPRLKGTGYEWWLNPDSAECMDAVACINEWNRTFVETVRAGGGNNAVRYLMVTGYVASADGVLNDAFALPEDTAGRLIVSVHAYIPYAFAMQSASEGGNTSVFDASSADSTGDIDTMLANLNEKFIENGVPVVIGEFGAREKNGNTESRAAYAKYYVSAAGAYGICCCWWDNNAFGTDGEGFGLLDRAALTWKYPEIVNALIEASAGN